MLPDEVLVDGSGFGLVLEWDVPPEELPVSKGNFARAVDLDGVLVELLDLNDNSRSSPPFGTRPSLVLDPNIITNL